jgi:hypothetical protein
MKTLLSIGFILGIAITAMAQKTKNKDVPADVKASLQKNFNISDATWDKEGDNFEANYKAKGKEMSVVFSNAGAVLETESEIEQDQLPAQAQALLKKEYSDFKVEEAARISVQGVISYEAEVEKGEQSFELIFDQTGNLIKKESEKEKDDQ